MFFFANNDDGFVNFLIYGIFNAIAIRNVVAIIMTTAVTIVIGMFIAMAIAKNGAIITELFGGINRA